MLERQYSQRTVEEVLEREAQNKLDDGKWKRFSKWCQDAGFNPYSPEQRVLAEFLVSLGSRTKPTLNSYKRTIEKMWDLTSDAILSTEIIPSFIIDSAGKRNPMKPKYSTAYDIGPIVDYIRSELNVDDDPEKVRLRLILLLRIVALRRSSDVHAIIWDSVDLVRCSFRQTHHKGQKSNRCITEPIFFEPNAKDKALCLHKAFADYLHLFKEQVDPKENPCLLMRQLNKVAPLQKNTIANLVLKVLEHVGIDTKIYKSHSLRMSSATAMIDAGMPIESVMKIGNWETTNVFLKFYHRAKKLGTSAVINKIADRNDGSDLHCAPSSPVRPAAEEGIRREPAAPVLDMSFMGDAHQDADPAQTISPESEELIETFKEIPPLRRSSRQPKPKRK